VERKKSIMLNMKKESHYTYFDNFVS